MAGFELVVDEGPRFSIMKVAFVANAAFTDEELNAILRPQPNTPYRKTAVDELTKRLRDAYLAAGYLFPTLHISQHFLERPGEVEVVIEIAEGSRFRTSRVQVTGADEERQLLLLKSFPLTTGDIVSVAKITDWANAHGAVLDLTHAVAGKFTPVVYPTLLQNEPRVQERLRAGESIEIELAPSTGAPADDRKRD